MNGLPESIGHPLLIFLGVSKTPCLLVSFLYFFINSSSKCHFSTNGGNMFRESFINLRKSIWYIPSNAFDKIFPRIFPSHPLSYSFILSLLCLLFFLKYILLSSLYFSQISLKLFTIVIPGCSFFNISNRDGFIYPFLYKINDLLNNLSNSLLNLFILPCFFSIKPMQ